MKNRVVFDIGPGSDTWPPSKGIYIPGGKSFAEHSFNSAAAVAAKELAEKNGFEILLPQQPCSPDVPLSARSYWINREHRKSPILCLLSFHANAAADTVSGHCVFHWSNSRNGKHLAELWNKYANAILPIPQFGQGIWESRRGSWTNFHILRETVPPAILMEHFFYTNPEELRACNTPEFIRLCAETAVKTICEYAGAAYKGSDVDKSRPDPPPPERADDPSDPKKTIYRVQVGAYTKKDNAEKMAAELKAKGYETIVVKGTR